MVHISLGSRILKTFIFFRKAKKKKKVLNFDIKNKNKDHVNKSI